eukprot:TRINITY_DN6325_c0_g1_i1.p1 TRINITY_DN6325_c0_g1~~TRINITY_DN6325_c0_g1_i1.p1  ORF type:complete len:344 (-),score=107.55 TRINITY_DN6325_c0_g1_i1:71-1072(-)
MSNSSPNINTRSPTIKRILSEVRELRKENSPHFHALPLQDNLFEWHFTIRGPSETDFDGGIYHGKIVLPHDYPFNPPNIIFTTPNGRWETGKKICLTVSSYHPESWRPSWSIRTVLMAIIGFMPLKGSDTTGIGSLSYSTEQRQILAKKSLTHHCEVCGVTNGNLLPEPNENQNLKEEMDNVLKDIAIEKIIDEKANPGDSPSSQPNLSNLESTDKEVISQNVVDNKNGEIKKEISNNNTDNNNTNNVKNNLTVNNNNTNGDSSVNKNNSPNNTNTPSVVKKEDTEDLENELAYLTPSLNKKQAKIGGISSLDVFIFTIFMAIVALVFKKFYV